MRQFAIVPWVLTRWHGWHGMPCQQGCLDGQPVQLRASAWLAVVSLRERVAAEHSVCADGKARLTAAFHVQPVPCLAANPHLVGNGSLLSSSPMLPWCKVTCTCAGGLLVAFAPGSAEVARSCRAGVRHPGQGGHTCAQASPVVPFQHGGGRGRSLQPCLGCSTS